jgi:hypothetical protein
VASRSPAGRCTGIVQELGAAALRIERTIRKHSPGFELRARQFAGATARSDSTRREKALRETSRWYAADLIRYATELWPSVLAFDVGCAELRQCYATLRRRDGLSRAERAGGTMADHVERLKLARTAREVAREAKRAVEMPEALLAEAGPAVRQINETFDQYVSALDALESLSLEAVRWLGGEPT